MGPDFVSLVNGCFAGFVNHVEFSLKEEKGVLLTIRYGATLPSVLPLLSLDYKGLVVVLKGLNVINNFPFHIIGRALTLYSFYILNVGIVGRDREGGPKRPSQRHWPTEEDPHNNRWTLQLLE